MVVKGKWGSAACAVALTAVTVLAAGCSSSSGSSSANSIADNLPTNYGPAETTTLNVGAVPAMDSAGFFVALNEGLFTREGLTINYTPATSSETAIEQQLAGQLQISAGNYVSYIAAASAGDPLEVVSEGSVMQQGAQTIFVMPKSHITSLAQLKGKLVGVNAPNNIDYLLDASVLKENGIDPDAVRFPTAKDKASRSTTTAGPSRSRHGRRPRERRGRRGHAARAVRHPRRAGRRRDPADRPEPGRDHRLPDRGLRGHQGVGGQEPEHAAALPGRAVGGPGDRRHQPGRSREGVREHQGRAERPGARPPSPP